MQISSCQKGCPMLVWVLSVDHDGSKRTSAHSGCQMRSSFALLVCVHSRTEDKIAGRRESPRRARTLRASGPCRSVVVRKVAQCSCGFFLLTTMEASEPQLIRDVRCDHPSLCSCACTLAQKTRLLVDGKAHAVRAHCEL